MQAIQPREGMRFCPKCNGYGTIDRYVNLNGGICHMCNGSGEVTEAQYRAIELARSTARERAYAVNATYAATMAAYIGDSRFAKPNRPSAAELRTAMREDGVTGEQIALAATVAVELYRGDSRRTERANGLDFVGEAVRLAKADNVWTVLLEDKES